MLLHGVPGVGKTSTAGMLSQAVKSSKTPNRLADIMKNALQNLIINHYFESHAVSFGLIVYQTFCSGTYTTAGDLGLTPETVEKELDDKFHLASTWDCVLLLDEADVFLAQRTRKDLQRNALVSGRYRKWPKCRGILADHSECSFGYLNTILESYSLRQTE